MVRMPLCVHRLQAVGDKPQLRSAPWTPWSQERPWSNVEDLIIKSCSLCTAGGLSCAYRYRPAQRVS